jgi:hypothetical protein
MPTPFPQGIALGEPVSVQGETGWFVCGVYKPEPNDEPKIPGGIVLEVMHP